MTEYELSVEAVAGVGRAITLTAMGGGAFMLNEVPGAMRRSRRQWRQRQPVKLTPAMISTMTPSPSACHTGHYSLPLKAR